jgi:hypothetical protein
VKGSDQAAIGDGERVVAARKVCKAHACDGWILVGTRAILNDRRAANATRLSD